MCTVARGSGPYWSPGVAAAARTGCADRDRCGRVQHRLPLARPARGRESWASCREPCVVIIVCDEEQVETSLATGELVCPACGGRLRRHGWTRERSVRTRAGQRRLRPARVRCTASDCGRTQVLLPAWCVPGRSADAETIGSALTAAATGVGHRRIAARLGLAADTVRGWLCAAHSHADWLYARACRVQGLVRTGAEDSGRHRRNANQGQGGWQAPEATPVRGCLKASARTAGLAAFRSKETYLSVKR